MSDPAMAVVTVTRNSARVLPGLLSTLARHLPQSRIVVVDCASTDGGVTIAREAGATVIELEENIGFGRATNRGLQEVAEPASALLNPDVELLDDSLAGLADAALRHDRLLAPRVLSVDGSVQDTVHPRPASIADLARSVLPQAGSVLAPWRSAVPRPVGWAVGCALVARTSTLLALGPFDERIFMYGEDLDLCLHAAERGIETWFCPAASVVHLGGHASVQEFGGEAFDLIAQARHDVVGRRLGRRAARIDDGAQALTFASRITARRLLGRDPARERSQLRALRAVHDRP
jgi:GT2 family glycosyltransferase